MKWMIASDIHGSAYYCRQLLNAYNREQADRLLLLGDLLYHGPRNDLPEEYDPKQVIELLNAKKQHILCVRGNCDAEVDQMVLQFPIMADYCAIADGDTLIYATHGHTHVPACVPHDTYTCMNPGSVAIPKAGSWHGYLIMENGRFQWKTMTNEVKMEFADGKRIL